MADLFQDFSGDSMWEINLSGQLLSFCYAVALGMILSLVYDIFKALRLAYNHKTLTVFFEDIFYFLFSAFATFIFFLIFTGGEIRLFILVGLFIGFFVWKMTLSYFTVFVLRRFLNLLKSFFAFINRKIIEFLNVFGKFFPIFKKILKNIQNRLKKLLKTGKGLLYTKQE